MTDSATSNRYGLTRIESDLHQVTIPTVEGASHNSSNVYVLGTDPVVLIDAGSDDPAMTLIRALECLGHPTVTAIYLTHAHADHAGGVKQLSCESSVQVWLPKDDFDEQTHSRIPDLQVDCWLQPGHRVRHQRWTLDVVATPGHAPGHVSFVDRESGVCFAGDLVSGEGTIAVVHPRGSMSDYIESLKRIQALQITTIYPGHGPIVTNGLDKIRDYIQRRLYRESQVLEHVAAGVNSLDYLMEEIYPDIPAGTRRLARGTIRAHLEKLIHEGRVVATSTDIDSANLRAVEKA